MFHVIIEKCQDLIFADQRHHRMQQPIDEMQQLRPVSLAILIRIKSPIKINKYCWQLTRREVFRPYEIQLLLKISSSNFDLNAFLLLGLKSIDLIQEILMQIE